MEVLDHTNSLLGTIEQNLPQSFQKVLFGLSDRSGDPRGSAPPPLYVVETQLKVTMVLISVG